MQTVRPDTDVLTSVLRVDLDELDGLGSPVEPRVLEVDTPAGPWSFQLSVGGVDLPAVPTSVRSVGNGLLVGRWAATAGVEVSLVMVDFLDDARSMAAARFPEPAGLRHLDGAWGALLRVTVLEDSGPVTFAAALPAGTDWDPEGGQYLAALHVEVDDVHLSVGGSDEEGLENGTQEGWLPRRWAGRFAPDPFTVTAFAVTMVDEGFRWRLPGGEGGDRYEVAAAAVWGASEIATWFTTGDVVPPYLHEVIERRLAG